MSDERCTAKHPTLGYQCQVRGDSPNNIHRRLGKHGAKVIGIGGELRGYSWPITSVVAFVQDYLARRGAR